MEQINLQDRIAISFADYQKATGFQRGQRHEFATYLKDKSSEDSDDYESDDLLSVESDNEPVFHKKEKVLEMMIKGKTKVFPMVDEYDEDNQHVTASDYKLEKEAEENFDDMVLDEGVNATKIRW